MEWATNNGLDWRIIFKNKLLEFNIQSIIPNYEEEKIVEDPVLFNSYKQTDLNKFNSIMKQLIEMDLHFVEQSDFIICKWNGEKMSGTIGEVQHAYLHDIPVFLITNQELSEIPGWFLSCCSKIFQNDDDFFDFIKTYSKEVKMPKEKEWITKDSGDRKIFETGAQRDRASGKGRYDLISPFAIKRLCGVYERGAEKYNSRNYEKGIPLSRFIDSAMRHLFQVIEGREDEDHISQAMWNITSYIHTEEMIKRGLLPESLNDIPSYEPINSDIEYRQSNKISDGFLYKDDVKIDNSKGEK